MALDLSRIAELIIKSHNGSLGILEQLELNDWLELSEENRMLYERFSDPDYVKDQLRTLQHSDKEGAWAKIFETISETKEEEQPVLTMRTNRPWRRNIAAAAILITVLGAAAWIWFKDSSAQKAGSMSSKFGYDVLPGGNKATLTLANGSTILLADAAKGVIAEQGNTKIEKLDNGQLSYNALSEKPEEVSYNTLTTPPAGQYQVMLPDGTRVWLNNASSLRYPTAFTGSSRSVELKGEAYFEVTPNSAKPFKVQTAGQTIDVLGTSFNIMAYGDESIVSTTLLTGGVKVSRGNENMILKPGEQAQSNTNGAGLRVIKDVDADGVIAWKNGLFHFERADLRSVMRVLARWYDVDVEYEGQVTNHLFGGDIQRNLNLSQVLDILQHNQVHFSIEDKKITVRP